MFFQKNGGYWQNLRGIFAKNGPARPAEILGLNGPARPDLSTQRFTTLLVSPDGSKVDFSGTLFSNQLRDFSLLSWNSFLHPFLKSKFTKKFLYTKKINYDSTKYVQIRCSHNLFNPDRQDLLIMVRIERLKMKTNPYLILFVWKILKVKIILK